MVSDWPRQRSTEVTYEDRIDESDISSLLSSLVSKSIVEPEIDSTGNIHSYRLLASVREFTRERLLDDAQDGVLRTRHRDYLLGWLESARQALSGPEQATLLDEIERQHEEFRAALEWTLGDGGALDTTSDPETALRLVAPLQHFWEVRGFLTEGRGYLAAVLEQPTAQPTTKARADALNGAGTLALRQGDYSTARAAFDESLTIHRQMENKKGIAHALGNLGHLEDVAGNPDQALILYEESCSLSREVGDKSSEATSLGNMGIIAGERGDEQSALKYHETALEIWRELGDERGLAMSLHNLGNVAIRCQKFDKARARYLEAAPLIRRLGDRAGAARLLHAFGELALAEGSQLFSSLPATTLFMTPMLRAIRLHAVTYAIQAEIGEVSPEVERQRTDQNLSGMRQLMGERQYEDLWRAGATMTWQDALDYAVSVEASSL